MTKLEPVGPDIADEQLPGIYYARPGEVFGSELRRMVSEIQRRRAADKPTTAEAAIEVLKRASDLFHEILSAINAKELVAGLPVGKGVSAAQFKMREALEKKLLDDAAIARRAGNGFELCVLQLAAMGVSDITFTSCGPGDICMPGSEVAAAGSEGGDAKTPDKYACKVCLAVPDETGERSHSKACYQISCEGGGSDWPME